MLDFTRIRGDSEEGRRAYFEQLVCRLGRLEQAGNEFRRVRGSGGDGGVEALWLYESPLAGQTGYQAKYFVEKIDWRKIDDSVNTALAQHPKLTRYVVALPRDFTGKRAIHRGSTKGEWGEWDDHKKKWLTLAAQEGMKVEFVPWTAFELEGRLRSPDGEHLLRFFFPDTPVFTRDWMRRQLARTVSDLQARYSPDDHVDTEGLKAFDVALRRENVRRDLRSVFDVAHAANPSGAAALVSTASVTPAQLVAAEDSLRTFTALKGAVDDALPTPWPVCRWFNSWHAATRQLADVLRTIQAGIPRDEDSLARQVRDVSKVTALIRPEVFGGWWAYLLPIDGARAILFAGRAGAGKSHLLARGAELAWREGAPVVHILGQHIQDNDPRVSILNHLGLKSWCFRDALAALDLAAEMAHTRALLVIDALNEGRGLHVWPNHLASFLREVNEFERVVLVLSCREEYLPYVVSKELIAQPRPYLDQHGHPPQDCEPLGKLVPVRVEGFRTTEERERALQKYMDDKGIARPTAPVLDSEFFNPLFMSSVCRSMAEAGLTAFPHGLHGTSQMFKFVLETKAQALGTDHDRIPATYNALLRALHGLADIMVKGKTDYVLLDEAVRVVDSAFCALPIAGRTWLKVLEGSGILRCDVEAPSGMATPLSMPKEVIRFAFQRLQDHLMAQRLISECSDVETAFAQDGPLGFLVSRALDDNREPLLRPSRQWLGVLNCVWIAIAEDYRKELYDLQSFFGHPDVRFYVDDLQRVFAASVRERRGDRFTERTRHILNYLWQDDPGGKLEILISLSCIPGHAWSADFIAERLFSMSASERREHWSQHFGSNRSPLVGRATEIVDWAVTSGAQALDNEVVRLAATTLTCLCVTENVALKDRAILGLRSLLAKRQTLAEELLGRFGVRDPEIAKAYADALGNGN